MWFQIAWLRDRTNRVLPRPLVANHLRNERKLGDSREDRWNSKKRIPDVFSASYVESGKSGSIRRFVSATNATIQFPDKSTQQIHSCIYILKRLPLNSLKICSYKNDWFPPRNRPSIRHNLRSSKWMHVRLPRHLALRQWPAVNLTLLVCNFQ